LSDVGAFGWSSEVAACFRFFFFRFFALSLGLGGFASLVAWSIGVFFGFLALGGFVSGGTGGISGAFSTFGAGLGVPPTT
jgi:hypothetical protein